MGYLLIFFAAFLIWKSQSLHPTKRFWMSYMLSLFILGVGVYLTRMTPYLLVAGGGIVFISLLRCINAKASRFLLRVGCGLICTSPLVLMIGQFESPLDGARETEDRSDKGGKPIPSLTDAEKLNQEWSTEDDYADWPVAELMLDFCQIAYLPSAEAREELKKRGFSSETIESGSMNGYVVKSGDNAAIILRGTESKWHDILQDLIFISSKSGNGRMHAGFRNGYDNYMHQQVRKLLQKFGTKRVWITGHSLGGALAVVCAHDLLVDGNHDIAGVMTFGQPKVVRKDMKDFLEPKLANRYVVFANDMDPVVKAVEPYLHFGHIVHYKDGKIERSKRVVQLIAAGPEDVDSEQPTEVVLHPQIDSFSERELKEYIQQLQDENKPLTTPDGQPIYTMSFLPDVSDHYLESYREMIKFLISNKSSPSHP